MVPRLGFLLTAAFNISVAVFCFVVAFYTPTTGRMMFQLLLTLVNVGCAGANIYNWYRLGGKEWTSTVAIPKLIQIGVLKEEK